MPDFVKVDDHTIKKVDVVTETRETTYDYDFLIRQRDEIQAQKDRDRDI